MGVGFYSSGPTANSGGWNPASLNGYYAAYEFCFCGPPGLMYNDRSSSSGGSLPTTGQNYLFAETIATPSSISMNALTTTSGPFMTEPSITLSKLLAYDNATGIDNSKSTLYIGGATDGDDNGIGFNNIWSYEYVYWLRILTYSTTPTSTTSSSSTSSSLSSVVIQPSNTQYGIQTVTSTQPPLTQTQTVTQSITQTMTPSTAAPPLSLSNGATNTMLTYALIAIVVAAVVIVGIFIALKRMGGMRTARPALVTTKLCRSCGNQLGASDPFCDRCGARQT